MRPLIKVGPVLLFCLFRFVYIAAAVPSNDACELQKDLKQIVSSKYPGRAAVNLADLADADKEIFKKEHGNTCPGLVKMDFYGDGNPTLAMALTTKGVAKGKTELVVAHQVGEIWETKTLETTDGGAPVVWTEKPGDYTDVYGERKVHATKPVIVFCKYESWAILYAWTNNAVVKIWLSD